MTQNQEDSFPSGATAGGYSASNNLRHQAVTLRGQGSVGSDSVGHIYAEVLL